MEDIFTIGYSGFEIDEFINVLKKYKIDSLIDVRSSPISKYYDDYNKNNLENLLKYHNIIYRNYSKEFGARQTNPKYYPEGYLDFNLFAESSRFLEGVNKINTGISMNYKFVFMCAEKDPSTCHRNIMVARQFYKMGYNIKNILADQSFKTQDIIEKQLVEEYFPNRNQLTLFSEQLTWDEMVNLSYKKRNIEIGYRIDDMDRVSMS